MMPLSIKQDLIELETNPIDDNTENVAQEIDLNEFHDTVRLILPDKPKASYHPVDNEVFAQNVKKYLNLKTSKLISLSFILIFITYHGYLNSFYGRNSCNQLLEQGYLRADDVWQPSGCMIHNYTKDDANICFKYVKYLNGKNKFLFIGDTRIRQIFKAFIAQFDPFFRFNEYKFNSKNSNKNRTNEKKTLENDNQAMKFQVDEIEYSDELNSDLDEVNYLYSNSKLNLEIIFIWSPVIDEQFIKLVGNHFLKDKPNLIITGMASHYLNLNVSVKESISLFRQNLTSLMNMLRSFDTWKNKQKYHPIQSIGGISWSWSEPSPIYWVLQDKLDEYKYYFNRTYNSQFTNDELDEFNKISLDLLHNSPISIWSSNRLVSKNMYKDSIDGFLIGKKALKIDTQILFNLYCNGKMNYKDASCCAQPETISILQKIIFSIFIIIFFITIILFLYRYLFIRYLDYRIKMFGPEISLAPGCKNAASSHGIYDLFSALSKFAFFMFYFFACDRANYFMKENKHFTLITFLTPFIYVSIVGFFFQDKLPLAKVMNRYQTDELKGFMQIFILFYRLSGAEKNTILYLTMRLFTGTYLFLSGYGHFMYFWNTSNFGITRFFEILFRLNFLPIMLCFTMNRMYQFYEFVPLITFWFVCAYLVMVMYPRVSENTAKENSNHYIYMLAKLLIMICLVTLLNLSENFFERIFMARPWKFLFIDSDHLLTNWHKIWSAYCYSFIFGMIFALICCFLRKMNLIDDYENNLEQHEDDNLEFREKRRDKFALSLKKKIILVFISLLGLISSIFYVFTCKSKEECDIYIPYIMIVPVVSYFIVRNTLQFLREKCSFIFSWFGKISLELYVCSYHIWLAADSSGVLVLLPDYTVLNSIISIFLFLCISHELNKLTRIIGDYIFPNTNWKACLKNFIIFCILLLPIAIKCGYF